MGGELDRAVQDPRARRVVLQARWEAHARRLATTTTGLEAVPPEQRSWLLATQQVVDMRPALSAGELQALAELLWELASETGSQQVRDLALLLQSRAAQVDRQPLSTAEVRRAGVLARRTEAARQRQAPSRAQEREGGWER